jgi:hypothetical protein
MNQCSRMLIPLEELRRLSAVHDELLRGIKKGPRREGLRNRRVAVLKSRS